jgi:hypothetical protein
MRPTRGFGLSDFHRAMVPIEQKESMRWLDNLRRSTELSGAPERCMHIGDRESDIYELYCLAQELGTNFLVRSCVDRLAEDGKTTIAKIMADVRCLSKKLSADFMRRL